MAVDPRSSGWESSSDFLQPPEILLERGEVVHYPTCPFSLPQGGDLQFLLEQRLASSVHKNISYDPRHDRTAGFRRTSDEQAERLRSLLRDFSRTVTEWLSKKLPAYSQSWRLDRVSYRPEEEATRKLRLKARNDLLHVDAFPSRPTHGQRILRFFVNINPTDPRIWVTSDPFARLLARYGKEVGLPGQKGVSWTRQMADQMLRVFRPGRPRRSAYDEFMLRFHDFLKANENFQERGPKKYWTFRPNSAWMAFTDTASHAVLRGRFALEHSYFVAPESLVLPLEAPAKLLEVACGFPVVNRAA